MPFVCVSSTDGTCNHCILNYVYILINSQDETNVSYQLLMLYESLEVAKLRPEQKPAVVIPFVNMNRVLVFTSSFFFYKDMLCYLINANYIVIALG